MSHPSLLRAILAAAVALSALAITGRSQTSTPILLTGFNQDLIIGASETSPTVTAVVSGWNYYEVGFSVSTQGLPVSRTFLSAADSNIQFQLADYDHTNNTLVVGHGGNAALSLVSPGSFQDIHFLATTQGGPAGVNIALHFTDNTTTAIPTFNAVPDWTIAPATIALANMGLFNGGFFSNPLYLAQLDYTLSTGDQAKTMDFFTVSFPGNNTLMVFGASGTTAIPEPATYGLLAGLGALGLAMLRRRTTPCSRPS